MLSPVASFSRITSTAIRVPAMTGLPIVIEGSDLIRLFMVLYLRLADCITVPLSPLLYDFFRTP